MAQSPPIIPVGLDAYRQWERWPYQRIGARAYMRSTYDRAGGNEGADASHFLFQTAADYNVSLDVEGPGMLYFVRTNHWHGSPWHYVVDGTDNRRSGNQHGHARQTRSRQHLSCRPPRFRFPSPKPGRRRREPIFRGFLSGLHIVSRWRTAERTTAQGYYIYHQYLPGARLSQPLHAWNTRHDSCAEMCWLC